MIYPNFIAPVAVFLFLASSAYGATAADVVGANSALLNQTDTVDIAVVAITDQTSPTTAQQVPPSLQSLTNSISAAHSSLTPTTPTSDPATEMNVVHSWGLFANTVEELMDDYVRQSPFLINKFGLKSAIFDQLLTFNTTFLDYATFMATVVSGATYQANIQMNTKAAIGNLSSDTDGILEAFRYYT